MIIANSELLVNNPDIQNLLSLVRSKLLVQITPGADSPDSLSWIDFAGFPA
jgi:hypothetical protein